MPDVLAVEVAAELAEEATAELEKETADEKDSFNHNHALHVVHREDSPTSQPSHPSKKWNPKHTVPVYAFFSSPLYAPLLSMPLLFACSTLALASFTLFSLLPVLFFLSCLVPLLQEDLYKKAKEYDVSLKRNE